MIILKNGALQKDVFEFETETGLKFDGNALKETIGGFGYPLIELFAGKSSNIVYDFRVNEETILRKVERLTGDDIGYVIYMECKDNGYIILVGEGFDLLEKQTPNRKAITEQFLIENCKMEEEDNIMFVLDGLVDM